MTQRYARIALPVHLDRLFDYAYPKDVTEIIPPGTRVEVPFRNKFLHGLVIESSEDTSVPKDKIKSIRNVFDKSPLITQALLQLCRFANAYYHHPIGEIFSSCLPKKLKEGQKAEYIANPIYRLSEAGLSVPLEKYGKTPKQQALLNRLREDSQESWSRDELYEIGFSSSFLQTFLQKNLLQTLTTKPYEIPEGAPEEKLALTSAQEEVVQQLSEGLEGFTATLLEGVTGSGKTEVYLQIIEKILATQKQVLVLVPEIALTPQTIARFQARFRVPIAVLHSNLNDTERHNHWLMAQNGDARIIIGTRSALFTPFKELGYIVIDEEHDASFKQQDQFRYSGRDLAIVFAMQNKIPILLGTATPSIETFTNAKNGKYRHLTLPDRVNAKPPPEIKIVDCRAQKLHHGLSNQMLHSLRSCLEKGEQAILFINRRGYSPVLMCHECGWFSECKRCDAKMTYHREPYALVCHYCLSRSPLPSSCPECQHQGLSTIGIGTQRLEEALSDYFPEYPILRIDRDNMSNHEEFEKSLGFIRSGKPLVMIGTQLLAKGHHFPKVTLVGIVDTDSALYSSEFRAIEHMGQLITQVAGRAGRAEIPGQVVLQTYHPDDPNLTCLVETGYPALIQKLMQERESAHLPPFTSLAVIRAEALRQQEAFQFLNKLLAMCPEDTSVETLGPLPLNRPKRAGYFRGEIILRSHTRRLLQTYLQALMPHIPAVAKGTIRWHLEVDPIHLLS